jgi:putrescine transport system ATP-binding protein
MAEELPKIDVAAEEPVKPELPAKRELEVPAKLEPAARPEPEPDVPLLRIEGVAKKFGNFRAVDHVSLDVRAGEFFALLGPSGCGKTTLLRMLAGFETPDEGRILLSGRDIAHVLPHERPVNMMFQNYALFPHLSVRDNIAFGLKRAGMARADIDTRVAEMVALVKLEGLEKRKPDQLSGGQKQRVALARSLARRPQVLLLDEPLAALDKKLRESTQHELMELQRRLGMTFIIVTHDQEEAMTMAGRIGVMDAGRLDQVATPRDLYEAPASRWIAEFVGDINLFEGQVGAVENGRLAISTRDAGTIHVAEPRTPPGKNIVSVAIRPEKVKLSRRAPIADGTSVHALNRLEGVITDVSYLGGLTTYKVKLDSGAVVRSSMANTTRIVDAYSASQRVVAWFTPDDCLVLEQ